MNRRSFFNRIARAAAIVALAPQIAFRAPKLKFVEFWSQTTRRSRIVDEEYLKVYAKLMAKNPSFATFRSLDLAERKEHERLCEGFFYR